MCSRIIFLNPYWFWDILLTYFFFIRFEDGRSLVEVWLLAAKHVKFACKHRQKYLHNMHTNLKQISDNCHGMDWLSYHSLLVVFVYKNWTTGGLFWVEFLTHLLHERYSCNSLHAIFFGRFLSLHNAQLNLSHLIRMAINTKRLLRFRFHRKYPYKVSIMKLMS